MEGSLVSAGASSPEPLPAQSARAAAVPIVAALVPCALLAGTAALMAWSSLALLGDGAYFLVRIIGTEDFFNGGFERRALANVLRQGPVVATVRAGVTDTHTLAVVLGVGQIVLPAAAWCASIVLSRPTRLVFAAVTMAAGVCAGSTWLFNVSESVLFVPLTSLVAVLLWEPRAWGWWRGALACAVSLILVATYQGAALTAPLLACWAAWRAVRARSLGEQAACAIVALLAVVAAAAAATDPEAARRPNGAGILASALLLKPWPQYVAIAGAVALVAAIAAPRRSATRTVLLVLGLLGWTVATLGLLRLTDVDALAARGGGLLTALLLTGFLFALWIRGRNSATSGQGVAEGSSSAPRWTIALPVAFCSVLVAATWPSVIDWSRSLDAFRSEVRATRGVVALADRLPPDRRAVVWGWTASSLSLIVRDDPANGVLVDGNPSYIPFPPEQAREQIPDRFTWRR